MSTVLESTDSAVGRQRKRPGVHRLKRHALKTDMTPMVDLGFLLISFFVFTANLREPRAMDLFMPKDGPPTTVGESTVITFLLGKNNTVFYYSGKWTDAMGRKEIHSTDFSLQRGIGAIIREKQQLLDHAGGEGRAGLMMIIKAGEEASYKNVIDALDETTINGVTRYALVKIDLEERRYLQQQ